MERFIVGYVFTSKQYREAVKGLFSKTTFSGWFDNYFDKNTKEGITFGGFGNKKNSIYLYPIYLLLNKAGVLDLWFKPVYSNTLKLGTVVYVENSLAGAFTSLGMIGVLTDANISHGVTEPDTIRVTIDSKVWGIGSYDKGARVREATPSEIQEHKLKFSINGYAMELEDTHVKFGCATISAELFINLAKVLNQSYIGNKSLNSVTIGSGTFSEEQVKNIADYYRK